eukprot:1995441-Pleurochrysis_carterae.AAC.1
MKSDAEAACAALGTKSGKRDAVNGRKRLENEGRGRERGPMREEERKEETRWQLHARQGERARETLRESWQTRPLIHVIGAGRGGGEKVRAKQASNESMRRYKRA